MKTEIWVSFNYGGWSLVYKKIIELPFTPFFGLGIIFNNAKEYKVTLDNDDYCGTTIDYNIEKKQFDVNVRNVWKRPVSDETIDGVIEQFADWEKKHMVNIDDLKDLMKRTL